MSNSSWTKQLAENLTNLARNRNKHCRLTEGGTDSDALRIAVVGIGNELNGDDAAGVMVIRSLEAALEPRPHFLLVDGGPAPENVTGPLRRFQPDLVLLIDAAYLEQPPGSIAWVDWENTEGFSASTHTLPPHVFAEYLIRETGCQVGVIGVQPAQLEFAEPMSPPVEEAVRELAHELTNLLSEG